MIRPDDYGIRQFEMSDNEPGRVRGDMAALMQSALSQSEAELARLRIAYRILLASRAHWRRQFFTMGLVFIAFLVGDLIIKAFGHAG